MAQTEEQIWQLLFFLELCIESSPEGTFLAWHLPWAMAESKIPLLSAHLAMPPLSPSLESHVMITLFRVRLDKMRNILFQVF